MIFVRLFLFMYFCYILYSATLDRFYIGSTSLETSDRLDNHLTKYYGASKFTAKANDWNLFFSIKCSSYSQARKIETHIKKMRSKTYINNLKRFPEISTYLINKFTDS
jgi:putative endonuclease